MSEPESSVLGPSCLSTICCPDVAAVVEDYCHYLHLKVAATSIVDELLAEFWQCPELVGANMTVLANACGEPWLRLVEVKGIERLAPLKYHGWMALEVLVENVDSLIDGLTASPFKILRPVANLELSDNIRACQVEGPCGEVYYFTQIKGDVPPFDLPRARCVVDRLFIPVLCAPDRQASQRFYESFPGTSGLAFDTKITVINQAYGLPLNQQHPVATLMLRDQCLIEIDEIDAALTPPAASMRANIASIGFEVDDLDVLTLDWLSPPRKLAALPYSGRRVGLARGPAGEWLELIER
ncbi:hypothetical protein G8770_16885 [Aestuariicella hydrocarbonica]|uniref:Uncharacterized protein n=1 Tax=Pseudomaricurvus hydrocarbonicus TaxID=1470433 RepID=A0A9E5MMZ0_9GAMM|nr:hypothetical protein [Aestuariicella hydrocarbonica]NHO67226.1 hypothetical protein [Aestuariicella hydrocarbonica]